MTEHELLVTFLDEIIWEHRFMAKDDPCYIDGKGDVIVFWCESRKYKEGGIEWWTNTTRGYSSSDALLKASKEWHDSEMEWYLPALEEDLNSREISLMEYTKEFNYNIIQ